MNLNRTLDSIIFRYARRNARLAVDSEEDGPRNASLAPQAEYDTFGGTHDYAEPFEDEVLESYVGHVGSCNSDEGCYLSTSVRVNPRVQYRATLRAAQIDMEQDSEKLSFVTLAGRDMGNSAEFCNCYIILSVPLVGLRYCSPFQEGPSTFPLPLLFNLTTQ